MKRWKCLNEGCADGEVYTFKGLCRTCTTYGADGSIETAVHRVRINEGGTAYELSSEDYLRATRTHSVQDFVNARRPKMTNKQRRAVEAAIAAQAETENEPHVHDENCGHNHMVEIGESVMPSAEPEADEEE